MVRAFEVAIRQAFPGIGNVDTAIVPAVPRRANKGDLAHFQCNAAMSLCKELRGSDDPELRALKGPQVAQRIVEHLPATDIIERCDVVAQGFISIFLSTSFLTTMVTKILTKGVLPPNVPRKRVIVDFSSPNIAKGWAGQWILIPVLLPHDPILFPHPLSPTLNTLQRCMSVICGL